jgi:hypothetical protein
MALSDHDLAVKIYTSESDLIRYPEFDKDAGIDHLPEDANKQTLRMMTVKRINTLLGNGISGYSNSYRLNVETRGELFKRIPLQESAVDAIRALGQKLIKRADEVNRMAAFALQKKGYYSLTDKKNLGLRKVSPEIDSGHRHELEQIAYGFKQKCRMLSVMFENMEEDVETIERISGGNTRLRLIGSDQKSA